VTTKQTRVKAATNLTDPWQPIEPTLAEVHAIKALVAGKATEHQQSLVVEWIAKATAVTSLEFRPGPDGDRASAFAAGKRFVGLQFFQLAKAILSSTNAAP
jgi:hypothetical protein